MLRLSWEAFTKQRTEPRQGELSCIELSGWHCSGVVKQSIDSHVAMPAEFNRLGFPMLGYQCAHPVPPFPLLTSWSQFDYCACSES